MIEKKCENRDILYLPTIKQLAQYNMNTTGIMNIHK